MSRCLFLAALLGCQSEGCQTAPEPESLSATATLAPEMPAVFTVAWENAGSDDVSVEWGESAEQGHTARLGTGPEGSGVVVGGHPGSTVHWRLTAGSEATPDESLLLGDSPVELPTLTVTTPAVGTTGGLVLTSTLGLDENWVIGFDHEGVAVWWVDTNAEGSVTDVRPSADGRGVLYQTTDPKLNSDIAKVTFRAWTGEVLQTTRTPNGHHDFVVLPNGDIGFCTIDVRNVDIDGTLTAVVGDAIAEMPAGSEDASAERVVWSAWDTFPMRKTLADDTEFYSFGLDWSHCNGLAYVPEDEAYLVSLYELGSVSKIAAASGERRWTLGGDDATIPFVAGEEFDAVHSPEPVPGGLRVFNNRAADALRSRVLEYQVDEAAQTASLAEAIDLDHQHFSYILGDSNSLPEDHLLVSWGSSGLLSELDAERNVIWEAGLELGTIVGFTSDVQTPGQPQP